MNNKRRWILVAALQVLFLLFIAGSYYSIDYLGKEIKIKTTPVDPRDILYGDYVTLRFDISTAPLSKWKGDIGLLDRGQRVAYVVLEENKEGYHVVQEVYPEKPDVTSDQIVLKAKTEKFWSETNDTIRLIYGFERYYIQENTGKELEQQASDMDVILSVAPWGAHKIIELQTNK
ncbi:GDYXXLXY domain-containing protein [Fictibacillus nanhaiensis]|uniref:GDYXXLXY domain-containing protein n=1 Tax=Fictibacillus nanhaiensis TaxID=742169 RepID=UPI001C949185|nr:GDYXXLXY domain-containing protein [Fictibacillus nanhaiensis]MBY6038012.1 GDYXXLXY domain-containing protein [Fictibacillus nanhaiensis]